MKPTNQNKTPRRSIRARVPRIPEHVEAKNLMHTVRLHETRMPDLRWLHAVPNGGARSKIAGAKLKAEGVRPGVPDYALPVRRGDCPGLVVELKAVGGRAKPEQKEWLAHYKAQGWQSVLAVGWEAAWVAIRDYLREGKS